MKQDVKSMQVNQATRVGKWRSAWTPLVCGLLAVLFATASLRAASNGQATAVDSAVAEKVPTSPSQNVILDEEVTSDDPNVASTVEVIATTSSVVLSAAKTDLVADTGPVTSGFKEASVVSPKAVNLGIPGNPTLGIPAVNAGGLAIAGVHSKVVISSAGVDSTTTVADLNFVLKNPATGSAIVTFVAKGMRTAASATSSALTGAVTTDSRYFKFDSEELGREEEESGTGGVPPSLSNKKLPIPGGYVVLEEKIETLSTITVNALHVVFKDATTGTDVDIVIGSATAGR